MAIHHEYKYSKMIADDDDAQQTTVDINVLAIC
jgi:hypothetical protein